MKKRIISLLSISLVTANIAFADYSFVDPSDFTGDALFSPPVMSEQQQVRANRPARNPSLPPLKKLRLKVKKKLQERESGKMELAPVAPSEDIYAAGAETSEFASKDLKEEFDETMMPDGFEADEEAAEENVKAKHFWQRKSKTEQAAVEKEENESIILDCENIDYDTNTYCVTATGNASVNFVEQGTIVKAEKIIYDRMNNTIKADGNVRIHKNGQVITGEYIFVDMNEENALIEKPVTETATIAIQAKKGYVYGDKIVQEDGSVVVDQSFPINFRSMNNGPWMSRMLQAEEDEFIDSEKKANGIIKLKTRDMVISQKGDLEIISLKKASVFKGKRKIFKIPSLKIYTNKNFDFVDTNSWELGSYRGLGMFVGPGFVFEVPGGSVLKAIPMLNYHSGFGIGGIARYSSASNWTQAAYGTVDSKFMIRGKQDLDDHLYLQYAMNDYMREWFLGRRRPKYGASLVYDNEYTQKGFLLKNQLSSFRHRVDLGYYHDYDEDKHFKELRTSGIGTTRARYMAQVNQALWSKEDREAQKAISFNIIGQASAALYGTGDTQVLGRLGPVLHTQYKRWMQDIGYFQSVYEDNSPLAVYDAYRYGKSNIYAREYIKLNRFITLSWFGSMNISGDSPDDRRFQENCFYITFGPEDIKFSLGYDIVRENTHFMVEVMMDAKGTQLEYDRMEIKQDKKAKKREEIKEEKESDFQKSTKPPVLQRAVVEDVKTLEDVL